MDDGIRVDLRPEHKESLCNGCTQASNYDHPRRELTSIYSLNIGSWTTYLCYDCMKLLEACIQEESYSNPTPIS